MAQITEADVSAASEKLIAAKKTRGTAGKGKAFDAYLKAADELAELRKRFRVQEEKAGNRVGFTGGDATEEGA